MTIRLTRPQANPFLFLRGSEGGSGGSEVYPLSEPRLLAVRFPLVGRLVRVAWWFFLVVLSSLVRLSSILLNISSRSRISYELKGMVMVVTEDAGSVSEPLEAKATRHVSLVSHQKTIQTTGISDLREAVVKDES